MKHNKEKRMKKNEDSLRNFWDSSKWTNIHIIGILEGKEWKKKPKKIFEKIIAEKFHNMGKGTVNQVQEGKEFQTG